MRFKIVATLLLLVPLALYAWVDVSAPSSANVNQSYTVEASGNYGGQDIITVYENGYYFTEAYFQDYVSQSTSKSQTGSVYYYGESYYWQEYDDATINIVDTTPPSTPTGLYSSSVTMVSFTLNWSASSDNVGVTAYEVKRDSTSLGTTSNTSMSVTGLTPGTQYGMTVRARDAAGNWSSWSSVLYVSTQSDTSAPSTPTGLSASSVTANSFTLTWNASSDNVGVTGYEVFRDSTSVGTTTGLSMAITGLSEYHTYSMTVKARDAANNWSSASSALNVTTLDVSAPSVPGSLSSSNKTGTSFTLSWGASTDNPSAPYNSGVSVYQVKRDSTVLTPTTSGTSMSISGLTNGTTYAMRVQVKDNAGNWSGWSGPLNVTTLDTAAPTVPSGLGASGETLSSFTLSWSASTDNVGVTDYEVRHENSTSVGYTGGSLSKTVTGLNSNTGYPMQVRARDQAGNWSSWSTAYTASTLDPANDADGDGIPLSAEDILGTSDSSYNSDSSNTNELKISTP